MIVNIGMIKRLRRSWLGETRTGGRLVTVNLEKEVAGEQEPLEVVVPVSLPSILWLLKRILYIMCEHLLSVLI